MCGTHHGGRAHKALRRRWRDVDDSDGAGGEGGEVGAGIGELVEVGEVFEEGDAGAEDVVVDRATQVGGVVDVQRVDAEQGHDALNIDDTTDLSRPVHHNVLGAGGEVGAG